MERRADAPTTKRAKSGRSIATAQLPRRRSYGTAKDIAAEVQGGTHLRRCSWRQALRRRAMPICRHFSMHAGRPGAGTRMDARCGECNASERRHAEVRVTTSTRPADGCLYRAVCRHDCMDWCPSCKDATIPSLRQQDVTPGTSCWRCVKCTACRRLARACAARTARRCACRAVLVSAVVQPVA